MKPGEQISAIDVEIWGAGLPAVQPVGWFKVESTAARVTGFFLIFNGSHSVVDGADVSNNTLLSGDCAFGLYCGSFNEIEPNSFTRIHVVNPNPTTANFSIELFHQDGGRGETLSRSINPNDSAAKVTMQVLDKTGSVVRDGTLVIPTRQRISKLLTEYFPDIAGVNISSSYIRIVADKGVAAYALFGTKDLSALAAVPPQVVR